MAKWEQQLKRCLDAAFKEAGDTESGVRDEVFKHRRDKFEEREVEFDKFEAQILSASALVGKVARACADHDRRPKVRLRDMLAGIAAAKQVCDARVALSGEGQDDARLKLFFLWCE